MDHNKFASDLYVFTSNKRLVDGVAIMDQNWNFSDRVEVPKPARFVLQLAVDDVILNVLGIEAEGCPLGVRAEPHVDQSDGLLIDGRHGGRVRAVVPGVEAAGAPTPHLGTSSHHSHRRPQQLCHPLPESGLAGPVPVILTAVTCTQQGRSVHWLGQKQQRLHIHDNLLHS